MERMRLPSDVLRRITFAVIATLLALGAIALTDVRAPREATRLAARLSASDAKLAQAISTTIDPRAVRPAEAAVVHRVRTAYASYLTGRGVLVSASGDADAAQRNAAADRV